MACWGDHEWKIEHRVKAGQYLLGKYTGDTTSYLLACTRCGKREETHDFPTLWTKYGLIDQ